MQKNYYFRLENYYHHQLFLVDFDVLIELQSEMKTSFIFDPFKTREKWRERIWIPIQDGSKVIDTKYYIQVSYLLT